MVVNTHKTSEVESNTALSLVSGAAVVVVVVVDGAREPEPLVNSPLASYNPTMTSVKDAGKFAAKIVVGEDVTTMSVAVVVSNPNL